MAGKQARELKERLSKEPDFIVRRRSKLWLQLSGLIAIAFAITYFSSSQMSNAGKVPVTHTLLLISTLIVLGLLGYLQVQRHRDLLLMTEFQNALFASVARLNYRFYIIARRDGTIVYYDPGFQKLFPEFATQSQRMLDSLFTHNQLPQEMGAEINRLLQEEENGVMLLPYQAADGTQMTLVVHVDPLPTPKGYTAIRGREYVERKEGGVGNAASAGYSSTKSTLASTAGATPELLSTIIEQSGIAAYAIDTSGHVIFANGAMEQALGYGRGEMTGKPADTFVYQANGNAGFSQGADAFEGEALFLHRNGGMVKFYVRQDTWMNATGQRAGCHGYLLPMDDARRA